ncbi:uncharacterized protein BDZ99DRAFT_116839 [Mytilinidion resinicola]|uniref:BZIP domain-containing protein n=1 Tax=Mytilinidion resinicola TaxID=574789 RepID=A0A6A6YAY8_9PEZI|nr:uncharacterized protein BDZ99DRAFT_116839 [Mytilinidion resinicola]KAF2805275.1 hypothetical protein BDZ99DRAFT_116839 [Mytilinidion resinicola]
MDYAYFNTAPPQHPYQFIGLPPTPTYSQPIDHDTIRSIEPLDTAFLPSYDAFQYSQNALPATSGSPDPVSGHTPMPAGSLDSGLGGDLDARDSRTRSSSEEKETGLTPAQSRRKAQNRAAQRAFRERKERHVRDLEAKLSALESSTNSLQSDNERLKLALQRVRTENELLRATSAHSPTSSRPVSGSYSPTANGDSADDADYNVHSLTHSTVVTEMSFRDSEKSKRFSGSKELPAQQTWDLIQSHPLVKQGLVDIADVCERLRGLARCDGHGPVFEERAVWKVVEESRRGGGDELI